MRSALTAAATAVAAALALTGCSFEFSVGGDDTPSVPQEEVEEQIVSGIEAETGLEVTGAECPGDLEAEEGVVMECVMEIPNGEKLVVDVEVDAVDGTNVDYTTRVTEELVD